MKNRYILIFLATFLLVFIEAPAFSVELFGHPGQASGYKWQSAYMDLDSAQDFHRGDRIVIRVEGSAEWVKVRLLPESGNPSQPTGLIGSKIKVPANGNLIIKLGEDRPRIIQISVHAGKEAWGDIINPKGGEIKILRIDLNP